MSCSREQIVIAALAVAVALPAVLLTSMSAQAGPFDILRESREGGEREHKVKRKRKKTESTRKDEARSHGQRRTGRTRTATEKTHSSRDRDVRNVDERRTGRTRSKGTTQRRHRSNGHVHTANCRHNRRSDTRRHRHDHDTRRHRHSSGGSYSHSHSSSTTVSVSGSSASIRSRSRSNRYDSRGSSYTHGHGHSSYEDDYQSSSQATNELVMPEVFVTLGAGAAGLKANQIADKALPGQDYSLGIGVKGDWLGAELGVSGSGYRLDPDRSGNDFAMAGVTGDARLQPKIDFVEPYVKAGLGVHRLYDGPIDESSTGSSLRLGAGVDFRGEHLGVGVEYLWSAYSFKGDTEAYGGHLGAQSGSIGARLMYHF